MGRPKSDNGETPKRNVRIADPLWNDAKSEAATEGRTITDVVATSLTKYVAERRAKRRTQRHIPISDDAMALMRNLKADHAGGSVFPPKTAALRTFIPAGTDMVLLDAGEVSRLLRALSGSYRAPLLGGVSQDLEQLADALDVQALTALDEARRDGA